MNEDPTSQQWNPMLSSPGDEFANFLDFANLDFSGFPTDISNVQPSSTGVEQNGGNAMDHTMEGTAEALGFGAPDGMAQMGQEPLQHDYSLSTYPGPYDQEAAKYNQMRQNHVRLHQHQWQAPSMVPPTPNSVDFRAGQLQEYTGGLEQQRQQQLIEHYRRAQKDQINFTPLISPAVTPIETQLRYPDNLHEAFSPLTSPALRAQNHNSHNSIYSSVRGSDTSTTTSPLDVSHDYSAPTSVTTSGSVRRSRRKMSSNTVKTPARSVKQSPAMKPQQKKKHTSSAVIPPREVASVLEEASKQTAAGGISVTSDRRLTAPEQAVDSVSPESLSEILMPPPATPQSSSAGRSPYLSAKSAEPQSGPDQGDEPATPASLMRIRKQAESATRRREASQLIEKAHAETNMEHIMEDIALPKPATAWGKRAALALIDTAQANIPKSDGSRQNGLVSAPITTTKSLVASPAASTVTSPSGPKPRKGIESKPKPREPRKRSSTSNSEKVSPALRPKISPSIKPLLPEGASVSPETSALLLASKSNYQNILEGTHFPGVSYPENLSTNLTSKRTSHKIAEQGRRNRINTALQEIALLLPPTSPPNLANGVKAAVGTPAPANDMDSDKANAAMTAQQQSNSKASTVEAAIDYIKSLQKEVRECRDKLAVYEGANVEDGKQGERQVDGQK